LRSNLLWVVALQEIRCTEDVARGCNCHRPGQLNELVPMQGLLGPRVQERRG
jgi:hypothetical protein